jgi:tRNA nucleotidyltransferase (CCA-adding enzyme)
MKEVFRNRRTLETGIRHGTLTVLVKGEPAEITTYRTESSYGDHRHPDHVEFTSALRLDCARRDFTVNALCASMDGTVHDFFGGIDDLQKKIIRCIGSPDERFDEDALRILRALRFAARLSFAIEAGTADALHRSKDLLQYISGERIHEELNGFFAAPACAEYLREFRDIFEVFIPELKALSEEQYESVLASEERSEEDPMIRTALLLRLCEGPENILKRLKYSGAEIRTVLSLISGAERPLSAENDLCRVIRDYPDTAELFISFRCALDPSFNHESLLAEYRRLKESGACCSVKQLAVNGNDLKNAGLAGRQIAEMLNELLDEVIEKRLKNSRSDLLGYIGSHKK